MRGGGVSEAVRASADAAIAEGLARARARWPAGPPPSDAFRAYLDAHLARRPDPVRHLDRLHVDDLYLAWWAGHRDDGITAFEGAFEADVARLLARFHRLSTDELRQRLRIRLFVGEGDAGPAIQRYDGVGHLQNWVRITAARCFIDVARAEASRGALTASELGLDDALAPDDVFGTTSAGQLGDEVKRAFERAVEALPARGRLFLRHATLDHLTLDQIAATYGVHRATVARVLAQTRATLVDEVRRQLGLALGLGGDELAELVAGIDSRLDLSLARARRRRGAMTSAPCVRDEELADFVAGELPGAERPRIERHLGECARCRAVVAAIAALAPAASPSHLGRFELGEVIGSGGMSVVWSAWDPLLERTVAIKVLHTDEPAARRRLLHEARALARLAHPHVVAVYEIGEVDGELYIATERVDGETSSAGSAAGRGARWPRPTPRPRVGSPPRTPPGWCTATSSRATC
ncbi:MAG: zf-HC2 domain-containing protein [Kofleriaceae bacterium]